LPFKTIHEILLENKVIFVIVRINESMKDNLPGFAKGAVLHQRYEGQQAWISEERCPSSKV
jgi:hypothetical protein